LVQGLSWE